jgi:hypothetical protein
MNRLNFVSLITFTEDRENNKENLALDQALPLCQTYFKSVLTIFIKDSITFMFLSAPISVPF